MASQTPDEIKGQFDKFTVDIMGTSSGKVESKINKTPELRYGELNKSFKLDPLATVSTNRLAGAASGRYTARKEENQASMVTHEELNAKLELIEERMDRRVENIERLVKVAITEEKATREAVKELKKDNKSTKATIRNTGITVVIAVLSLVSLVTLLSNSWIQRSVTSIEASSTRIEQKVQENTESILKLTQKK